MPAACARAAADANAAVVRAMSARLAHLQRRDICGQEGQRRGAYGRPAALRGRHLVALSPQGLRGGLSASVGQLQRRDGTGSPNTGSHASQRACLLVIPQPHVQWRAAPLPLHRCGLHKHQSSAAHGARGVAELVPPVRHTVLLVAAVLAHGAHPDTVAHGHAAQRQPATARGPTPAATAAVSGGSAARGIACQRRQRGGLLLGQVAPLATGRRVGDGSQRSASRVVLARWLRRLHLLLARHQLPPHGVLDEHGARVGQDQLTQEHQVADQNRARAGRPPRRCGT
jgi:hypothetical protein